MSALVLSVLSVVPISLFVYYYQTKSKYAKFWAGKNIQTIKSEFPYGSFSNLLNPQQHFGYRIKDLYDKHKKQNDMIGGFLFTKPALLVLSPEITQSILVKDFQFFNSRGLYSNKALDPLTTNLFFLENDKWKCLREKFDPTFTSKSLEYIFGTIGHISERLVDYLDPMADKQHNVEVFDLLARYTTDVIETCAFGIESNSLYNRDSEFRQMGKNMFKFSWINVLKMYFAISFKQQAEALGIRVFDPNATKYFMKIVKDNMEYRKVNDIKKNDYFDLLLQTYYNGILDGSNEITAKITFEELAAQCYIFFYAGYETSSTTMSIALHQLALNPDIQNRVRTEINELFDKEGSTITYEGISKLQYLEHIILETQRLYPPVATIHRESTSEYVLPNGSTIPKGVECIFPVLGFHRDPELFPNPDCFDPNRFTDDDILKRNLFSFLGFGSGPRTCIGKGFALLQTKVGLAYLLRNYVFSVCNKTEDPVEIDPITMYCCPKNGIWLNIRKV